MTTTDIAAELADLSPRAFEEFLGRLWQARGWSTSVTLQSGDDGIDVVATRSQFIDEKQLIQAKHQRDPTGSINRHTVQQYAYLHQKDGVDEVLLVTNGTFSSPAKDSAETANIKLVNGETLAELLRDPNTETDQLDDDIIPDVSVDTPDETINPIISAGDVPEDAEEHVREVANSSEVYARLLATVGDENGPLHARLGVLLQLFSGSEQIHTLLSPRPQDSHSTLTEQTLTHVHPATQFECAYLDSQTLRGQYNRTGKVAAGVLQTHDDGLVILKRLHSLSDSSETLLEPLDEGLISVGTNGYHDQFDVSVSVLATFHPENKNDMFDLYEAIIPQIPLDPNLTAAFDYISVTELLSPTDWSLPDGYTDDTESVDPVSPSHLRYHRALAASISPSMARKPDNSSLVTLLRIPHRSDDSSWLHHAMIESLPKLARASARMRLSETVRKEDIDLAIVALLGATLGSTEELASKVSTIHPPDDRDTQPDVDSDLNAEERETLQQIRDTIIPQTAERFDEEPGAPLEEVTAAAEKRGISTDFVSSAIDAMRWEGEAYEPKKGYLRTT